jgi:hypothetical protein
VCATQVESEGWVSAIGELCKEERRRSNTLKAMEEMKGHRQERSMSVSSGEGGGARQMQRSGIRSGGRETHNKLMQSLTELKVRVNERLEDEDKEGLERMKSRCM